mgnify:FL=1
MALSTDLVAWMKAAGEPSRLRLLALCSQRDFSVTDLAVALGQSEPRVSRHLKVLCDAGLVSRLRQGQWVHYGIVRIGPAGEFLQGLLAQLDREDPLLAQDRARLRGARARTEDVTEVPRTRLGRALRAFVESRAPAVRPRSLLLVGLEHVELLECAVGLAEDCTVLVHSKSKARSARSLIERQGLTCRVELAASDEALAERDLARIAPPVDAILLDALAVQGRKLASSLACARRALSPAGQLWVFERYDSLEGTGAHPLAGLRRLLADAGLACERLGPIDADGEHVLAAAAVPVAPPASAAASVA